MAAGVLPLRPIGGIRACAGAGYRKQEANGRKRSSSNWWSPLFGWSSESTDYIDGCTGNELSAKQDGKVELVHNKKQSRSRSAQGCFTEEKAKQLRMLTMGSVSFHEAMYHSAIASRMASDYSHRSDR